MDSAVALAPLQLKSSLNILKQSPEAMIDLIAQYRKVLDETESEIKLRGVTIEHPLVRRFRHWNPVIVKEGKTLIWNPKKQIHSRPQDILQAARAILKAIGCIQFFREGAITVEAIQSISPMLIEMVNGAASAKTILSAVSLKNLDNLIEQLAIVYTGVDDLRGQAAEVSTGVDALISANQGKYSSLRAPSFPSSLTHGIWIKFHR
jgi:hypothetical protein